MLAIRATLQVSCELVPAVSAVVGAGPLPAGAVGPHPLARGLCSRTGTRGDAGIFRIRRRAHIGVSTDGA